MNEDRPTGLVWKRFPGSRRCWILACIFLFAGGQASRIEAEPYPVLRLGFTSSVFTDVNENDAKAALKLWARAIARERGADIPTETELLNGASELANALRNKTIDAATITTREYWTVGRELLATNAIVGVNAGSTTEEYVLLVRKDSSIGRIDDLRGQTVALCDDARDSLAPIWFETLLLKAGLSQTDQFCSRIIQAHKISQVVLPVFFHQANACVVTRRGFEVMSELNPQIGQQLKILASSSPMVPVVFIFRADFIGPTRDVVMEEIDNVHSTVADQQVFTLFQCDAVHVFPVSVMDTAMELLATHASLVAASDHAGPAAASVPFTTAKTDGR